MKLHLNLLAALTLLASSLTAHAGTMATATVLRLTGSANGAINPAGELDYYKLAVTTAGTLRVNSTGNMDLYGELLDSTGNTLTSADDISDTNANFALTYTFPKAGTYYLCVMGYYEDDLGNYGITSTFTPAKPDDFGNTTATAKVLTLANDAVSLSGSIERAADVDIFRVSLPVAGTLRAFTTGTTNTFGTLYGTTAKVVATNDQGSVDANFDVSGSMPKGIAFIGVKHADASLGIGDYQLNIVFTPTAVAPPATGTKRALCVGINNYKSIEDLSLCINDANGIAALLKASGWQVTMLTESQATKAGIEKAIRQLAPGGGQFLFTFSGHGCDFGGGADQGSLCAWDCTDTSGTISAADLNTWLAASSSTQIGLVFDSCFSGGMISRSARSNKSRFWHHPKAPVVRISRANEVFARSVNASNRVVITGSKGTETSKETSQFNHGLLSYSLINAFKMGKLDLNKNLLISMEESYPHALSWVSAEQGTADPQTPQFFDGSTASQHDVTKY